MALPTQATLGYAQMSPSIVEKVNGVQVKSFKHLNQLLDLPAPGGTHRIEVTQQPYTMYMSQKEAAKADRFIQMRAVPQCSAGTRNPRAMFICSPPGMSLHTLNIRLDFPYRTGFTHGAFRPENDALASLMEQRPGSRVLVLLEKGLEQFYPQLPADIDRYFEKKCRGAGLCRLPFRSGRGGSQNRFFRMGNGPAPHCGSRH